MKNLTLLWVLLLIGVATSCTKQLNPNDDENTEIAETMDQMIVDPTFNWQSGITGKLVVSFTNPQNASIENEIINLIDAESNIIKRVRIEGGEAVFNIDLPENTEYYVYLPVTGDKALVTSTGTMTMELGETTNYKSAALVNEEVEYCSSCDKPMINPGSELPVLSSGFSLVNEDNVPGWETTASDKQMEIWTSGFQGVPAQEGRQFFELNGNMVSDFYQELCLNPGSTITWSVWHRGRSGVDVAVVKIGATLESAVVLETMSDGNTAWGQYTGVYTVPEGQTTTVFVFSSVSAAGGSPSVGNFLDNFEISCDFDGDGIPDDVDDAPTKADVSFLSYFPTSGKQVVAFEDLWPNLGDFDFNDLTLSNQVTISKNQSFDVISADFKVSIDAIGAGIHNGIGMMIYDENGNAFPNNIIASVSGDASLDNNNTNGIILTNDVFDAIESYYQNNGNGPTAVPDTLYFKISFVNNMTEFIPELYIFRTDDRSHEIHRSQFPGTQMADPDLFHQHDDNGNYKTANGLPWGIEIITLEQYKSPKEKVDMLRAYPQFGNWATSEGTKNKDWYKFPSNPNVIDISK